MIKKIIILNIFFCMSLQLNASPQSKLKTISKIFQISKLTPTIYSASLIFGSYYFMATSKQTPVQNAPYRTTLNK